MTNQRGQKMVALMWISLQQMTLEVTHSHLFQTAVRIFVFMYREENALSRGPYIRNVQTKLHARKSSFHLRALLFRAGKRHSKQARLELLVILVDHQEEGDIVQNGSTIPQSKIGDAYVLKRFVGSGGSFRIWITMDWFAR